MSTGVLALMGESFWVRKEIGDLDLILCLLEVSLLDLAGGGLGVMSNTVL